MNDTRTVVILVPLAFCACAPDPLPSPSPLQGCGWSEVGETGAEDLEDLIESPGFQAYLAGRVEETADGQWIIDGDILTDDLNVVASVYIHEIRGSSSDEGFRSTVFCGIPNSGVDSIRNPAEKLAMTYCFDQSWAEVPELRAIAEQKLAEASLAWESAADVNFIQVPSGPDCDAGTAALYQIQYIAHPIETSEDLGGQYGLANLPGGNEQTITFWTRTFDENANLPIDLVFVHELGHTLGLYHEMARFDQSLDEFDDVNDWLLCNSASGVDSWWRGVTARDPDSVMGYPKCLGTSPAPPHPSALDRTGLKFLYNLPRPVLAGPVGSDSGTLVWHRPTTAEYIVWNTTSAPGQPLAFSESIGCYDAGCEVLESSEFWKPILYRNSDTVDVLMYGPGPYDELQIENLSEVPTFSQPGTVPSNTDVPVLLDGLFDDGDKSVWWIRPGGPSDRLWYALDDAIEVLPEFDAPLLTDEHYSPVVGAFADGLSEMLWLSPTNETAYRTQIENGTHLEFAIFKDNCSLQANIEYNAVPGDYDGDGEDEILWYDFDAGTARYWPDPTSCMIGEDMPNIGQAKVAAVHLGGARETLMVYRPQDNVVRFIEVPSSLPISNLEQPRDASPILRDFDGDGCTDIIWFTPHLPTSQLWRSACTGAGIYFERTVQHPADAYPLGYGLGHGRR